MTGNNFEEELSLQQQYHQLCADKCKLLSAIESTSREGRALQKELHRLLDYIAEMLPEDYMEEDSEDDLEWLAESDEEISALESSRESLKVAEVKEHFMALKASPIRRRSLSPERRAPQRNRRNYRHLPVREDGQIDLPVILGRGLHRATLIQIGEVVPGSEKFIDGTYIYPVGFQIKRKYYPLNSHRDNDGSAKARKVQYYCSIKRVKDHPIFEISMGGSVADDEDDPSIITPTTSNTTTTQQPVVIESGSVLSEVWENFKRHFDEAGQLKLSKDFTYPESFFGLDHDSLSRHLKDTMMMMDNEQANAHD